MQIEKPVIKNKRIESCYDADPCTCCIPSPDCCAVLSKSLVRLCEYRREGRKRKTGSTAMAAGLLSTLRCLSDVLMLAQIVFRVVVHIAN